MSNGTLTIDLDAIKSNWQALDKISADTVETAAVVKANAYGLGDKKVATKLATAGVRTFFVASAEEGLSIREVLGEGPKIFVFSGHMTGKSSILEQNNLIPLLNNSFNILPLGVPKTSTVPIKSLLFQYISIILWDAFDKLTTELSGWSSSPKALFSFIKLLF